MEELDWMDENHICTFESWNPRSFRKTSIETY